MHLTAGHVTPPRYTLALQKLVLESRARALKIPEFDRRMNVLRQCCGDDIVAVLEDLQRGETPGWGGKLETATANNGGLGETLSLPTGDDEAAASMPNRHVVALAPAYIVTREFSKELAAITFMVGRALEMAVVSAQ